MKLIVEVSAEPGSTEERRKMSAEEINSNPEGRWPREVDQARNGWTIVGEGWYEKYWSGWKRSIRPVKCQL